jgi:hypothetical protein
VDPDDDGPSLARSDGWSDPRKLALRHFDSFEGLGFKGRRFGRCRHLDGKAIGQARMRWLRRGRTIGARAAETNDGQQTRPNCPAPPVHTSSSAGRLDL